MPYISSNVPSSIVYSTIGAELLSIARASNNAASFSTAITPLITRMGRQEVSIEDINSVIVKFFNKHQGDFNNIYQSNQELLNLVYIFFINSGQPTTSVAIAMQIKQ